MATHPALLSRSLIGWSSRYPARWIQLPNEIDNACLTKLSQILEKLQKVIKLGKVFLKNLWAIFFPIILGEFSENSRINRKPWENDFGLISWKIFFRRIVGQCSEYFRFWHIINYLLSGLLGAGPWNTKPSFFTHGPRKLGPYFRASGLAFHGTALASG